MFYNNKKAQLKILESIAVLIVFFFLVGLGLNFYGKIQLQSLQAAKDDFARNDAIKISQKIVHMPELRCSLQNTDQGSCIDLDQALAWSALQQDCTGTVGGDNAQSLCSERLTQYFEQIGVGEIVLKRTYSSDPALESDLANGVWILYNYSTPDSVSGKSAPTFTQIPVVIFDTLTKNRDLGVLQVRIFS